MITRRVARPRTITPLGWILIAAIAAAVFTIVLLASGVEAVPLPF